MKTPEEIKKGLGYCIAGPCPRRECPYYGVVPSCGYQRTRDALAYIRQLETQVRPGRWMDKGSLSCRCSECGCKNTRESAFCPNCGAKMDLT